MKKTYSLDQLDCAACAAKMEEAASQVPGVEELRINFLTKTMSLTASEDHFEQVAQNVMAACQRVEPECRVCEVKQDTAAHPDHRMPMDMITRKGRNTTPWGLLA